MKDIYGAPTRQAAQAALNSFEAKWGSKYGYAIKSWKDNWEHTHYLPLLFMQLGVIKSVGSWEFDQDLKILINIPNLASHQLVVRLPKH